MEGRLKRVEKRVARRESQHKLNTDKQPRGVRLWRRHALQLSANLHRTHEHNGRTSQMGMGMEEGQTKGITAAEEVNKGSGAPPSLHHPSPPQTFSPAPHRPPLPPFSSHVNTTSSRVTHSRRRRQPIRQFPSLRPQSQRHARSLQSLVGPTMLSASASSRSFRKT